MCSSRPFTPSSTATAALVGCSLRWLLCEAGLLSQPLLYLSLYFKQHRDDYYDLLNHVRRTGDWEAWIGFFLEGVKRTAEGAVSSAQRLSRMFQDDRNRIQVSGGRKTGSALRVHDALKARADPVIAVRVPSCQAFLSGNCFGHGIARQSRGLRARSPENAVTGYSSMTGIFPSSTKKPRPPDVGFS